MADPKSHPETNSVQLHSLILNTNTATSWSFPFLPPLRSLPSAD